MDIFKLIWELERKQEPKLKLLSPIIPLVLYHGKDKWDVGGRLIDIISLGDMKELRLYLPDFVYILYDLSAYSDEEIKGQILTRICLDLFKHIFDPHLADHLRSITPLLSELFLESRTALESIEKILRYITNASDISLEDLADILETVSKETGGMVMSLATTLEERGMKKGELIGDIRFLQLKKGLPVLDKKKLEKLSIEELRSKLKELTKI